MGAMENTQSNDLVLLFFVLNNITALDEFLEALLDAGIPGATVIDSAGMLQVLSKDVPIFAGLDFVFGSSGASNKTIFALVKKSEVETYVEVFRKVVGDLSKEGYGMAFTVPIDEFFGPVRVMREDE